ncbi:MAG: TolC family protein [Planctomycetota bacterium]|nr:TolC family protein [Planctomycetota bacterium]
MRGRSRIEALAVIAAAAFFSTRAAWGQSANIDSSVPNLPGSNNSLLGTPPGAGGGSFNVAPGQSGILGGRPGPTTSHGIPTSIATPGGMPSATNPSTLGVTAPQPTAVGAQSFYGSLALPNEKEDEGPESGLTVDIAIERFKTQNLDLLAKQYEIPMARADTLNTGLRANPIFYADGQLVPYGSYSKARPGGQTQYDVNITYPLDVTHKRQARIVSAQRAEKVLEALYQDAVRNGLDGLYSAFVDVLAARQTVIYSRKSVEGYTKVLNATEKLYKKDQKSRADFNRVSIQTNNARYGLQDAEVNLLKAKRSLATLLNFPREEADQLEVRGTIQDHEPPPPSLDELKKIAIDYRADVLAFRLGISVAEAAVTLQKRNAYPDVYVLWQPYTFQNNTPYGLKSPTSWALGITGTMPVYNRNQGGIQRAVLNVSQSRLQLENAERQAIIDVEIAYREYEISRRLVEQLKQDTIPLAFQVKEDTYQLYDRGELNVVAFLDAEREYNDTVKLYLDTLVRHRRSMLGLNTAVGLRILP